MYSKHHLDYTLATGADLQTSMNPGIYTIEIPMMGPIRYAHAKTDYSFPYKIYGTETQFIERVCKTYTNTTGNLGILLSGIKGTGKSVTAEMLCNHFIHNEKLPVFMITDAIDQLASIISSIPQDLVVFIDEYEKLYNSSNKNESALLSIMDGAMNSKYRRIFILTANKHHVGDYLMNRPGRIRYTKTFTNLTKPVIEEIVSDILIYPNRKDAVIEYISQLELITIDIVKSVVEEVNIHDEDPSIFDGVFNVSKLEMLYDVFPIENGEIGSVALYNRVELDDDVVASMLLSNHDDLIGKFFSVYNSYTDRGVGYIDKVEFRKIAGQNIFVISASKNRRFGVPADNLADPEYAITEYAIIPKKPTHISFIL